MVTDGGGGVGDAPSPSGETTGIRVVVVGVGATLISLRQTVLVLSCL